MAEFPFHVITICLRFVRRCGVSVAFVVCRSMWHIFRLLGVFEAVLWLAIFWINFKFTSYTLKSWRRRRSVCINGVVRSVTITVRNRAKFVVVFLFSEGMCRTITFFRLY
jgi:hypothetical protein